MPVVVVTVDVISNVHHSIHRLNNEGQKSESRHSVGRKTVSF